LLIKNKDTEVTKVAEGTRRWRASRSFIRSFVPFVSFVSFVPAALVFSGCRQDMQDQPKYVPLRESTFFGDSRSARPLVEGTVARGHLRDDALMYTGRPGKADATVFPFPIDARVMARGQERFNIFCSPCHGRTGQGDGMVVRRGYRRPPSYHQDRLREAPVGHFFDVITNGFGAMPDYASQIAAADRWAIVAYIRALQLSEHATLADVPAGERDRMR
jgi:mono/diheme cytochrome c family protein